MQQDCKALCGSDRKVYMATLCETALVDAADDDSEAGALDDLLGLGGALANASDDDADALVDDAFARRARGAGASVSGAKGWAVLDDALNPKAAARIRVRLRSLWEAPTVTGPGTIGNPGPGLRLSAAACASKADD